ncbi:hypothetical protein Naga_100005g48 [Nannochloropsis gaditana]|uniref:Uncharacterized protein n=1 Tax=Nannochloropsis gaditana TaxID=72520 RepID=W7TXR1_9STRA|nr:hypothetical protein Naga_100005g48 [Nannochloropsis gaditana]
MSRVSQSPVSLKTERVSPSIDPHAPQSTRSSSSIFHFNLLRWQGTTKRRQIFIEELGTLFTALVLFVIRSLTLSGQHEAPVGSAISDPWPRKALNFRHYKNSKTHHKNWPWKPHRAKLIIGTHEPSQLGKEEIQSTKTAYCHNQSKIAEGTCILDRKKCSRLYDTVEIISSLQTVHTCCIVQTRHEVDHCTVSNTCHNALGSAFSIKEQAIIKEAVIWCVVGSISSREFFPHKFIL